MLTHTRKGTVIAIALAFLASAILLGTAAAQKASVPKPQNALALGEEQIRQLLPVIDANHHGKVSKQQYMKFMEAEFERLDKSKTGELNVKELSATTVATNHHVGK